MRKLVLLVGLILMLLVLSLESAKAPPTSLSPAYLSGVSLTAYFAGVSISLVFRYGLAVALGATFLLPMSGTMLNLKGPKEFIATTASAGVAILLGVASAVGVWLWLGRTDLFRRRCGRPWLDVSLLWNPAAREKYRWAGESPRERSVPASRGDEFLLGTMTRCKDGSTAKYIWGRLYTWLLPGAGGRLYTAFMGFFGLVSAALAWYMADAGPFFIANIAMLPGAILGYSPINSPLLVVGGRRERFWATMTSIVVLGIVLTLSVTLMFVTMGLVGIRTLPESLSVGHPDSILRQETPMNLRLVVLLLALFPLSRLLEVKFHRKRFLPVLAQMIVVFPVIWLDLFGCIRLMAIPPGYVALAFVSSWVLCTYGVYRIAMRSDLGRK